MRMPEGKRMRDLNQLSEREQFQESMMRVGIKWFRLYRPREAGKQKKNSMGTSKEPILWTSLYLQDALFKNKILQPQGKLW